MRLTNILYQVNYHRHFQRIWKRQGKLQVLDVVIPPELEKLGVEIKDAKDFFLETQRYIAPKQKKLGPKMTPPSVLSQNKYLYLMHEKTKVSENENQTLALTKTVPYQGLPKELTSLIGIDVLPNQDELVKTSLLQAQVWDAVQHKLPRKLDISRPQYRFRREYGIRYKRKVSSLLEKLTYLCDCATGKYAASLQRNKILDTLVEVAVVRGEDEIIYQMPCDILLTSEEPLKPFASGKQVAATEKEVVPNIYPIKPTLDLDKYTESPFTLQPTVSFGNENIHTLFIAQKSFGFWFPKQLLARAIATCFAFTASEAQRKYGHDIGMLPEPISVQCMYMDIKSFNFIAYQLNTLDLSDNEGVKNQVWIDELSTLYDKVSEKDLITNYNPDIFPKMLAFYGNGIHTIRS